MAVRRSLTVLSAGYSWFVSCHSRMSSGVVSLSLRMSSGGVRPYMRLYSAMMRAATPLIVRNSSRAANSPPNRAANRARISCVAATV